jgi:hypothetical protein
VAVRDYEARAVPAIDWKAVRRRVRLIRAALDLPHAEAEEVVEALDAGDEAKLLAFASKHHQSLDWIIRGGPLPIQIHARLNSNTPPPPKSSLRMGLVEDRSSTQQKTDSRSRASAS